MNTVDQILQKYAGAQSLETGEAAPAADPVKLASEAGVRDAESMMKIATLMGDIVGQRAVQVIAESFGYDPEVMKVASLQDVMFDSVLKIAEQVNGTQASAAQSTTLAEQGQVDESAAHHANIAVRCATDAVQSLGQGDHHTAAQMLESAASNIQSATHHASRTANPAVHQLVNEAAAAVSEASSIAASQAAPAQ